MAQTAIGPGDAPTGASEGQRPPRVAEIDVLIPAYNAAATIVESIASIQHQTLRDLRIIVVDDGSTDVTPALLQGIARDDPRVVVITTANGGIVHALNTALARATAPLLARHDADDIAFADRFERQKRYLEANPGCIATGANAWHIDRDGKRTGRTRIAEEVAPDPDAIPSKEPYLMHPFLMLRREAMITAGGYRHVFHSEDTDLYWRLLARGRLHTLPDLLGEYRIHSASVSGVSVHNGRVAAIYSQLAAISFRRRQRGAQDLAFPADDLERLKGMGDVDQLIAFASQRLEPAEQAYLRIAVAGKLLELASYRPYLLDAADCRFIHHQITARWSDFRPTDRGLTRWHMADVVTRLVAGRRWRALLALRPRWDVLAVLGSRRLRQLRAGGS